MSAVPKLRFKEFEGEWHHSRVSELSKSFSGGTPESTRPSNYGGNIPFIRSGEIGKTSTAQFLSQVGFDSSSAKMVEKGDLLIAMYGANSGDAAIAQLSGAINQAILCIKYDGPSRFLFEQYSRSQSAIVHKFLQGGQGNLSGKIISNIKFYFPILPEQKKIADFLGAVDDKIAGLRAREDLLSQYKQGVMQKIFSQALRFKSDDGSDFPDWEVKKLSDVADRSTEKNKDDEHTRVLTNSAVRGVVDQGDYFDKDIANASNLDGYYVVKKGDFVYNPRISSTAPVGPIKRNHLGDGVMSPLYSIFRFKRKDVDFYEQFFETTVWHKYMKSVANYGARHDRMAISTADFLAMPLPIPQPDEQQKIADFLSAIDDKISIVSAQITQVQDFKKGLLQQMFV